MHIILLISALFFSTLTFATPHGPMPTYAEAKQSYQQAVLYLEHLQVLLDEQLALLEQFDLDGKLYAQVADDREQVNILLAMPYSPYWLPSFQQLIDGIDADEAQSHRKKSSRLHPRVGAACRLAVKGLCVLAGVQAACKLPLSAAAARTENTQAADNAAMQTCVEATAAQLFTHTYWGARQRAIQLCDQHGEATFVANEPEVASCMIQINSMLGQAPRTPAADVRQMCQSARQHGWTVATCLQHVRVWLSFKGLWQDTGTSTAFDVCNAAGFASEAATTCLNQKLDPDASHDQRIRGVSQCTIAADRKAQQPPLAE